MMHSTAAILLFYTIFLHRSSATQAGDNSTSYGHARRSSGPFDTQRYKLPYTGQIQFPMYDGKEIIIDGFIPMKSLRFTIRLCETNPCGSELPLIMNVFPHLEEVTLNYRKPKAFGREIVVKEDFFFALNQSFEIKFLIHNDSIKIFVNMVLMKTFTLVHPMSSIQFVRVDERVKINWILFSLENPRNRIAINRSGEVDKLVMVATPSNDYGAFNINLECLSPNKIDYALHFRIKFNTKSSYTTDRNVVGTGHRFDRQWGGGYVFKHGVYFPFAKDVPFTMVMLMKPPNLQVTINGKHKYYQNDLKPCYTHLSLYINASQLWMS